MDKKSKVITAIKQGVIKDKATALKFVLEEKKLEDLKNEILSEIPQGQKGDKGEKGDTGQKGSDGINGKDGKDGKDGKTPVIDTNKIALDAQKATLKALESKIPTIDQIVEQLPTNGEAVRDSLEMLTGEDRLDKSAIRGLEDYKTIVDKVNRPEFGGGSTARSLYQLYDVRVNSPGSGESLVWNTNGYWENSASPDSGFLKLDQTTPQTLLGSFKTNFLTAGRVLIAGTDGIITDDGNLTWNTSTKQFSINRNTASVGTPTITGTAFRINGADNEALRVGLTSFGIGGTCGYSVRSARGTGATPTATQANDLLGQFDSYGRGATGWSVAPRALIKMSASENYTDSAQGSYIGFWTTTTGGLVPAERWRITDAGHLYSDSNGTGAYNILTAGTIGSGAITTTGNLTIQKTSPVLVFDGTADGYIGVDDSDAKMKQGLGTAFTSPYITYIPQAAMPATSYSNAGGSGDRRDLIAISTTTPFYQLDKMINGAYANAPYFMTAGACAGLYIRFDFGVPKYITAFKWYQQAGGATHGVWKMQGSNDASSWTDVSNTFTLTGGTTGTEFALTTTTGYRYYQLLGVSGNMSNAPYLQEIDFSIADAPVKAVGVFNASPTYPLDIFGNIHAEGDVIGTRLLAPKGGFGTSYPQSKIHAYCDGTQVGTVKTTAGNASLVGKGTKFTQLRVGEYIYVSGETSRIIATITDDANLTVSVNFSNTADNLTYTVDTWNVMRVTDRRILIGQPDQYSLNTDYSADLVIARSNPKIRLDGINSGNYLDLFYSTSSGYGGITTGSTQFWVNLENTSDHSFVISSSASFNSTVFFRGGRNGSTGTGVSLVLQGGQTNDFQAGHLYLRGGSVSGTGTNGSVYFQDALGTTNALTISSVGDITIAKAVSLNSVFFNDEIVSINDDEVFL